MLRKIIYSSLIVCSLAAASAAYADVALTVSLDTDGRKGHIPSDNAQLPKTMTIRQGFVFNDGRPNTQEIKGTCVGHTCLFNIPDDASSVYSMVIAPTGLVGSLNYNAIGYTYSNLDKPLQIKVNNKESAVLHVVGKIDEDDNTYKYYVLSQAN